MKVELIWTLICFVLCVHHPEPSGVVVAMPHRWCRACLALATKSLLFRCMRMKQKGGTRPWKKLAVWHATFKAPTKACNPSQILSPKILLPWKIVMLCSWPSHLHSMSHSANAETSKTFQSSKQKVQKTFSTFPFYPIILFSFQVLGLLSLPCEMENCQCLFLQCCGWQMCFTSDFCS